MDLRKFSLVAVVALLASACSPAGEADDSTTSSLPPPTTSTTKPAPEAVVLSYALEAGDTYTYEVDIDQTIEMTATGDPTAMADEEFPGDMSIRLTGTTVFTQAVTVGPEPGTFEVRITGDFTDLEMSGTVDGEPVESGDIPDLAGMEPIDTVVIVDEQGNIIPSDNEFEDDLFGGLGGFGSLDQLNPGAGLGQFVGPPLAEGEVSVGDTWSETISSPSFPEDEPITTQIDSEIVAVDTLDGVEVFVIETTTTTSPIEFDLAELIFGFMFAFAPEDATDEERAEMDALAEQLRFAISVDETVANMTTWFDVAAGHARQADYTSAATMVFDINVPDETTGELIAFSMDMDIAQDVTYRLTGTDSS
jgi:hypothetical protein